MKAIVFILICLSSVAIHAQSYRMTEQEKEKATQVSSKGVVFLLKIENVLDQNNIKLKQGDLNIQNPAVGEMIKQGFKNNATGTKTQVAQIVCLACYEEEWKNQRIELQLIQSNQTYSRDSLYQRVQDLRETYQVALDKTKVIPQSKGKQVTSGESESDGSYAMLERQLHGMSNNEDFTLFRNLDYNFVVSRFSVYLQLTKGMAYLGQEKKGNQIIDKYTPGISIKKDEYLYVTYTVEEHPDRRGAFGEGLTEILAVEITGDPLLVVQLFTSYWKRVELDTTLLRESGFITSLDKMNDHIELRAVAPNAYKIVITKGNMTVNYEKTFGIHPKIASLKEKE